ncbi:N-terminal acetyltransferase A, auxiliary subunit [Sistotremastrum suecicum HHB10207 ss-3]|uniref:N-terminal acetyltransferase A, auxiliary subunit n=1 Tax=Sistotremastrum suecicum HHB10207 ss-3 TaxID=1314776 RepID=A0A166ECS9_9AGAM|nr:N-terminal acetyltransferase A, auxiliary subunit [Sistotremastrum suecicum HHB10207 ss-3]
MPPAVPAKKPLPSKEQTLFKELLAQYEASQYKRALKTVDQILKKFPDHGESLAMKGLVVAHMGRKEEGLELVRKGIRMDLTSHIVWHVFGLMKKSERDYEEAVKSYLVALRYDKDNMNIMRDAANMQMQLRNYEGLVDLRLSLLRLRPNMRQNWVAAAIAYYFNGQLFDAKYVLEIYEGVLKNAPARDTETSELLLFHARILYELERHKPALEFLETHTQMRKIFDRTAVTELKTKIYEALGKQDDADECWRILIDINAESYDYYTGFLKNRGIDLGNLTDETKAAATRYFQDFSTQYPKATAPKRLALTYSSGDQFADLVKAYIQNGLERGIPSLFVDLKSLYSDPAKLAEISSFITSFHNSQNSSSSPEPATYIWTLYFLAQHHSHLGHHSEALSVLDTALQHTPTLPDLLTLRAKVLKRAGDPWGAWRSAEEARALDGQDRGLNWKSAKYAIRAQELEEGQKLLGLFTKKEAPSPAWDLEEMQSFAFLIEEGDAHFRAGRHGLALKRYKAIERIFGDFEDDQFDFHGYVNRKGTLNVYIDMINWEDRLRSHPIYIRAALQASRIYLSIYDRPKSKAGETAEDKKAKKKAKKAAAEAKKAAPATDEKIPDNPTSPPKDDDPYGEKLISVNDPLEQAAKMLRPLERSATWSFEMWIGSFDVALRRRKYLQAQRALQYAKSLEPQNPELHVRILEYHLALLSLHQKGSNGSASPSPVADLLKSLLPEEVTPDVYNSTWLQSGSPSATRILAGARGASALGAPVEEVESILQGVWGEDVAINPQTALQVLDYVRSIQSSKVEEFRTRSQEKFPLSIIFKTPDEWKALKASIQNEEEKEEVEVY